MGVEVRNVRGDARRRVHLHGVHKLFRDGHLHLLVRPRFGESHVHLGRLSYIGRCRTESSGVGDETNKGRRGGGGEGWGNVQTEGKAVAGGGQRKGGTGMGDKVLGSDHYLQ